jgi:hypothetical protein
MTGTFTRCLLVFAGALAVACASLIGCGGSDQVGGPANSDASLQDVQEDGLPSDASALSDGTSDARAGDGSSDAGSTDGTSDADATDGSATDACTVCDGSLCCAPGVCRFGGLCGSCLGIFESCFGSGECCSRVCEAGQCR